MNFIFISPNFPKIYSHFIKSLNDRGVNVFGIGDEPYWALNDELKANLREYVCCKDLGNLQWMKDTVRYLKAKYGEIDFLESNNEYWLISDALLREDINVLNGQRPSDMDKIKFKSKMKEHFNEAGVKTARYTLSNNLEELKEFASKVGYPLFAKPDDGVGASHTYKINNLEELINYCNTPKGGSYIIEEYIDGDLISFDGICDDESNVVLAFNEFFPIPIAESVNLNKDLYYYANTEMPEDFYQLGRRVVKAFGIKKRCFHIEFFRLKIDKEGLGHKGDIIGLEVNMRSPGGNTPDLLSLALNGSYYDVYADVIVFNHSDPSIYQDRYISISVNLKNEYHYIHHQDEIYQRYGNHIKEHNYYSKDFRNAMGDEFYFATFKTIEEALEFKDFVLAKE